MNRPELNEIPLDDALAFWSGRTYMTMSVGQWDALLQLVYDDDWILLELDPDETPVRAYRKPRC